MDPLDPSTLTRIPEWALFEDSFDDCVAKWTTTDVHNIEEEVL